MKVEQNKNTNKQNVQYGSAFQLTRTTQTLLYTFIVYTNDRQTCDTFEHLP